MNEAVQLFNKQLSVVTTPLAKTLAPGDVLIKVSKEWLIAVNSRALTYREAVSCILVQRLLAAS